MSTGDKSSNATDDSPEVAPQDDFAAMLAASEVDTKRQTIEVGDKVRGSVIAIGQSSAFVAIGGKGEATIDLAEFVDAASGELRLAVGDEIEATVSDDGGQSGSVVLTRVFGRGGHDSSELQRALELRIPIEGVVSAETKGGFEIQIGAARAFCPGSQIDRRRSGERVPAAAFIGQRFRFLVTKVDNGGRNIVVSRRALLEEEAHEQAARTWETLQVGATVSGTVTSLQDFGAFVDLGGVEGLIHVSQLGYARVKHPRDVLEVGQTVQAQVTKIDEPAVGDKPKRRQIGLSLKALAPDPWATAGTQFPVGSSVAGTVTRLEPFGAFVELAPGIEGLVHISKITLDRRLSHARQALNLGDQIQVTILAVDAAQRRLSLSLVEQVRRQRDAQETAERSEQADAITKTNERKSLGTFADLLGGSKPKG